MAAVGDESEADSPFMKDIKKRRRKLDKKDKKDNKQKTKDKKVKEGKKRPTKCDFFGCFELPSTAGAGHNNMSRAQIAQTCRY